MVKSTALFRKVQASLIVVIGPVSLSRG